MADRGMGDREGGGPNGALCAPAAEKGEGHWSGGGAACEEEAGLRREEGFEEDPFPTY